MIFNPPITYIKYYSSGTGIYVHTDGRTNTQTVISVATNLMSSFEFAGFKTENHMYQEKPHSDAHIINAVKREIKRKVGQLIQRLETIISNSS